MSGLDSVRPADYIIFAVDVPTIEQARMYLRDLSPCVSTFKFGKEFLSKNSVQDAIQLAHEFGVNLMLDNKEFDVPGTLGNTAIQYELDNVQSFTIAAATGEASMRAMVEKAPNAIVIAVTVLTSMSEAECQRVFHRSVEDKVIEFAEDAVAAGCQALVCSAAEAAVIRARPDLAHLELRTPNIRPTWASLGKQNAERARTPREAIMARVDKMVIGSPIRRHPDRFSDHIEAAADVHAEVAQALIDRGEAVVGKW